MELKQGYKQTHIGVIPVDWQVKNLEEVFRLKHGFAFRSELFSTTGPIVLTPGNFKLEGGLYFEDRNTKRYSGAYSPEMVLKQGDLLIVMTDLTPDCKLLGKPAFIDTEEVILHNQRIGKVSIIGKEAHPRFLYYVLLSRRYLSHIKEQAFGSTVRHTSNKTIYSAKVAWPRLSEQRAIATALSDVDALLEGLDRLITKKRDIKQAAMQQLLTGKTRLSGFEGEWEMKRLEELVEIDPENLSASTPADYHFNYISLEQVDKGRLLGWSEERFSIAPSRARRVLRHNDVLLSTVRPNLMSHLHYRTQVPKAVCSTGFAVLRSKSKQSVPGYIFVHLFAQHINKQIEESLSGSNYPAINSRDVRQLELPCPPDVEEQQAIATIISDMDAEIEALEQRRTKTRDIKKAMMQELLTGRTRLV